MSENRRFYWIKLKSNFMTSDAVDYLMSQENGSQYVILYQMLCLMSIHSRGKLERKLGEILIPYDEEKIQRDTKYFDLETVKNGMQLFKALGLILVNENGTMEITDYENMIGSETASAERTRRTRNIQKALHCNTDVTKMSQKCNTDIDIDIDNNMFIQKMNNNEQKMNKFDWEAKFNEFWELYPRKQSKQNAQRKFKKLCTTEKIFGDILKGLIIQKEHSFSKDIQFIPLASTWLSQKRWEDDVQVQSNRISTNKIETSKTQKKSEKVFDLQTGEYVEL